MSDTVDIEFSEDSDLIEFAPYTEVHFVKDLRIFRYGGYVRLYEAGIKLVVGETVTHWPSPPPPASLDDYIF